jgi:hypothetical protein
MIVDARADSILRGKIGWSGALGWWVGWVEWPDGPVFFALNITTPNRTCDLSRREDVTRAVQRLIKVLPSISGGLSRAGCALHRNRTRHQLWPVNRASQAE